MLCLTHLLSLQHPFSTHTSYTPASLLCPPVSLSLTLTKQPCFLILFLPLIHLSSSFPPHTSFFISLLSSPLPASFLPFLPSSTPFQVVLFLLIATPLQSSSLLFFPHGTHSHLFLISLFLYPFLRFLLFPPSCTPFQTALRLLFSFCSSFLFITTKHIHESSSLTPIYISPSPLLFLPTSSRYFFISLIYMLIFSDVSGFLLANFQILQRCFSRVIAILFLLSHAKLSSKYESRVKF